VFKKILSKFSNNDKALSNFESQSPTLPKIETKFLDLVFLIDSSLSMKENDPEFQRVGAAMMLIKALEPADRIAVIQFEEETETMCALTTDKDKAINCFEKLRLTDKGTRIDRAILRGIKELTNNPSSNHRAILLFTDGGGTYKENLNKMARESGIRIFCIGLGNKVNKYLCQSMALKTGGMYLHAKDAGMLLNIFQRVTYVFKRLVTQEPIRDAGRLL